MVTAKEQQTNFDYFFSQLHRN